MPKTKKELPPVDWLMGAILCRKMQMHLDLKTMAKIACVSYERMRHLILKSPWDWPRDIRESVCANLGISLSVTPEGIQIGGCS